MISLSKQTVSRLSGLATGPAALTLIPVVTLVAYLLGGEDALIFSTVVLTCVLAMLWHIRSGTSFFLGEKDALTGAIMRDGLIEWADAAMPFSARLNREVAMIVLVIDDLEELEERFGREMHNRVLEETADRLRNFVRDDDVVARVSPGFAIGLRNLRAPETENLLQLSRRLQSLFDDPFSDGPARTYCSVSIGVASECHV